MFVQNVEKHAQNAKVPLILLMEFGLVMIANVNLVLNAAFVEAKKMAQVHQAHLVLEESVINAMKLTLAHFVAKKFRFSLIFNLLLS